MVNVGLSLIRTASALPRRPLRLPFAAREHASRFASTANVIDTGDAHEEVAEGVIEPLDVRQHVHGRMVRTACGGVHAVVVPIWINQKLAG